MAMQRFRIVYVFFLAVGIPFDVGSNAFALENGIMMSFSRIMNTLRINAYGVGIRFKIAFLFAFVADAQNTFYVLLNQVGNGQFNHIMRDIPNISFERGDCIGKIVAANIRRHSKVQVLLSVSRKDVVGKHYIYGKLISVLFHKNFSLC